MGAGIPIAVAKYGVEVGVDNTNSKAHLVFIHSGGRNRVTITNPFNNVFGFLMYWESINCGGKKPEYV